MSNNTNLNLRDSEVLFYSAPSSPILTNPDSELLIFGDAEARPGPNIHQQSPQRINSEVNQVNTAETVRGLDSLGLVENIRRNTSTISLERNSPMSPSSGSAPDITSSTRQAAIGTAQRIINLTSSGNFMFFF